MKKIAIVTAKGLGDGVIFMTLAHNFFLAKTPVTLFNNHLCELKEWFPDHDIRPLPPPEQFSSTFSCFDTIIAQDHACIEETHDFGNELIVLKEEEFNKKKSMVENLIDFASSKFSFSKCQKDNGIKPPKNLHHRKYSNRIILHPTSSTVQKNWPKEKFERLEAHLKDLGYDPFFCVSRFEHSEWPKAPLFSSLKETAAFLYESGYMIGNDSGIGHLASSLHIPTLSLFARKKYATLWKPGFGPGRVVAPPPYLIGARLRQKFWKKALRLQTVLTAFEKISKGQGEKR